jgi:hypothetical protein
MNADFSKEEQVPGKGMSFGYFLATIQNGDLHAELTRDLSEMGAALNQYRQNFGGEPVGEISVKVKFKLDKAGFVHISADPSVKYPKAPKAAGLLFIDASNNFTQDNPQQLNMGFPRSGPRPVA